MGWAWRGRGRDGQGDRSGEVPQLSADDVAERIGLERSRPWSAVRDAEPGAEGASHPAATEPVDAPGPRRAAPRPVDRRRILWWDSATLVAGVVLSLLALQVLGAPAAGPLPTESPGPEASDVAVRSLAPPASVPPAVTLGPVVDPSLGLDATPTPVPLITLGPTPRPTPTPAPPVAGFTFSQAPTSLKVTFTSTSSGPITSYRWTFGDGTVSVKENPVRTYASPGTYSVKLVVTGPGGTSTRTRAVTVQAPPTPAPTPEPTETPTDPPTEPPASP
jgi:hypothetical protein